MPVNNGDVLEVTFRGTIYGQLTMTTLHYYAQGPFTHTNPQLAADDFLTRTQHGATFDLVTPYTGMISDSWQFNEMTAQVVYPTRYVRSSITPSVTTGNRSGPAQTPNTAVVVDKLTPQAGRKFRGSSHIPAPSTSDYTSGLVGSALLGLMDAWGAELTVNVQETGGVGIWIPCIWHKGLPAGSNVTALTGYKKMTTMRVMRRRTLGVGK